MTTVELLRKAADTLDRGENPLATPFLTENEVTLDECLTMAEMFAIGARMVANGLDNPKSLLGQEMLLEMVRSA